MACFYRYQGGNLPNNVVVEFMDPMKMDEMDARFGLGLDSDEYLDSDDDG